MTGGGAGLYAARMESFLTPLLPLYERERAAGRDLALAINLQTAGSTYSKPGALLLIAANGEYAGLLSGGCLEGDLRERAADVIRTGEPCRIGYDMRGPDDLLWGLGAGCEGAMDIFMLRVGVDNDWQPLQWLAEAQRIRTRAAVGIVVEVKPGAARRVGEVLRLDAGQFRPDHADWLPGQSVERVFALSPSLPPRLLLLGAGPDAIPVLQFARQLGWPVTLYDHRPAYADAARFPGAERVVQARPEQLREALADGPGIDDFAATVVMSHHLESDAAYLRALAETRIPYIGLLGPAPRRERLRAMVGEAAARLDGRLRSPVGLDLGGRSAAAIALSMVAEIHAFLHQRHGGHFRGA